MSDDKRKRSHFYPVSGDRCRSCAIVCSIWSAFSCVYEQLMDGDDSDHRRLHSCYFSPARSLLQPFTIVLERQERSMEARTPHEQTALERQIEATDRQIEALVYERMSMDGR